MILVIDNYDSFTYNLVQYFGELGAELVVRRNDQTTLREVEELRPDKWGRVLRDFARRWPLVVAVFLMAISFFAFMKLLSMSDLSFAVPVTAASVVLETLLACVLLRESVSALRWAGALCVACGVALLAM